MEIASATGWALSIASPQIYEVGPLSNDGSQAFLLFGAASAAGQ
jgi:hypothetical protein